MISLANSVGCAEDNKRFGPIVKKLLLSESEAGFETRNFFHGDKNKRLLLERVGKTFIAGYNHGLVGGNVSSKIPEVNFRGFFLEGVAMGIAVNNAVPFGVPDQILLSEFLSLESDKNPYLATVGAGWAMARLWWRRKHIIDQLDNFLSSLAFDGWGFHDCYFDPRRIISGPKSSVYNLGGQYAVSSWYQGAGRALWFISCASTEMASSKIASVREDHRSDLYSGIGLAMTYAGGLTPAEARLFISRDKEYSAFIAQGAAFAIEAHLRAATGSEHNLVIAEALTSHAPGDIRTLVNTHKEQAQNQNSQSIECGMKDYALWRESLISYFKGRNLGI